VSLEAKLEQLRSLEVDLMRSHREEQDFNHTTYGARDFDSTEATMFSRAAVALSGLLDGIEEVVIMCGGAKDDVAGTGATGWVAADYVIETINGYLGDTA
jgi:hypothetical protein